MLSVDMRRIEMANEISWSKQTPPDFVKVIQIALALEAPLIARQLAEEGAKYHPTYPELKKIARIR